MYKFEVVHTGEVKEVSRIADIPRGVYIRPVPQPERKQKESKHRSPEHFNVEKPL